MKYYCTECKEAFDEDQLDIIKDGIDYEFWGQRGTYEILDQTCPHCGGDVVEAEECPVCGEYMPMGQELCDDCVDENANLDTALGLGSKDMSYVEINSYLAYKFSTEEIEDVLTNFLKISEDEKSIKDSIKRFYDENRGALADYLKSMEK